jgi:ATP-dependent Zn protease
VPEITAYHEAGHAFMAVYLGARVRSVTIDPDRDDGPDRFGDTKIEWDRSRFSDREFHEKSAFVALAGPVAEAIHRREPYHPGFVAEWASDWQAAWEAASPLVPTQKARLKFLEQVSVQLYQLLNRDENWAALAAIVDHLLAHERLEGEEIDEIISTWLG